jgi:glycosyltransferase involved in cell wall biosynthesis
LTSRAPVRELVFVDDARIFGGGQRVVLRLARFVHELPPDRSARMICPAGSELATHCRAIGIPVLDARFPGFGQQIPAAVRELRRVLADLPTDAVLVGSSLRVQVYAHAAELGRRERHRIVHFLVEQDSAARLTTKVLLRRYGAVVVLGDTAARTYQEELPGIDVLPVNNFLLPEEFAVAAAHRARPVGGKAPVLGVLARLFPGKGVVELVGELAANPDAWSQLLVAGGRQDESYAVEVEHRIVAEGLDDRVRLLGHVTDYEDFFGKVDVLVVPSTGNEGQPTVIVEALAYGRPVIVRQPIWSLAFERLPVVPYRDGRDLRDALTRIEHASIDREELVDRFGPMQALEAIERSARDY